MCSLQICLALQEVEVTMKRKAERKHTTALHLKGATGTANSQATLTSTQDASGVPGAAEVCISNVSNGALLEELKEMRTVLLTLQHQVAQLVASKASSSEYKPENVVVDPGHGHDERVMSSRLSTSDSPITLPGMLPAGAASLREVEVFDQP